MPTVLRVEGFRFFFFANEGTEPPHIHVERGDAHAKLWLEPVDLAYSSGYKVQELRRVRELTMLHRDEFLRRWHEYFGT